MAFWRINRAITACLCLVVLRLTFVTSTSDPRGQTCESVCWEERELENECIADVRCNLGPASTDAAFSACYQPCWDLSAPCRRMCNARYRSVLRHCAARALRTGELAMDCVLRRMSNNKYRWIRRFG